MLKSSLIADKLEWYKDLLQQKIKFIQEEVENSRQNKKKYEE